jgi:hypothetical protein
MPNDLYKGPHLKVDGHHRPWNCPACFQQVLERVADLELKLAAAQQAHEELERLLASRLF